MEIVSHSFGVLISILAGNRCHTQICIVRGTVNDLLTIQVQGMSRFEANARQSPPLGLEDWDRSGGGTLRKRWRCTTGFEGFRGPLDREDKNVHKGGRTNGRDRCATHQVNKHQARCFLCPKNLLGQPRPSRDGKGGPHQGVPHKLSGDTSANRVSETRCIRHQLQQMCENVYP